MENNKAFDPEERESLHDLTESFLPADFAFGRHWIPDSETKKIRNRENRKAVKHVRLAELRKNSSTQLSKKHGGK